MLKIIFSPFTIAWSTLSFMSIQCYHILRVVHGGTQAVVALLLSTVIILLCGLFCLIYKLIIEGTLERTHKYIRVFINLFDRGK